MKTISFTYRNHRNEVAVRNIIPDCIEYLPLGHPEFGYAPGWFISGFDLEKQARRSFALANIVLNAADGNLTVGAGFPVYMLAFGDKQ